MTAEDHTHVRPQWDCRVCGQPWPCPEARTGLLDEYRVFPSLLKIYLTALMYDALDDLTVNGESPPNLYERFLAWARKRSR
ncbi:hypothetical protein FB565_001937 [Actinoplanes lutulentus]|uniref:Flavin reductase n=1 Tax=Actinoplanes lutulentus TaxID=1287878 RepID=A0A327ZF46_9ACTN|nr:hypothetical protein [Actinoplanes lutulentus]MBB2942224.1 hypothetical protein [Actinoplanes lutulentus]RAK32993.1 hypothetical protein B0I29_11224 [Actinoplanes lutulentus]